MLMNTCLTPLAMSIVLIPVWWFFALYLVGRFLRGVDWYLFFALGILIGVRLIIVIAWHASSSLWAPRRTRWRNILGLRGDMT